MALEKYNDFIYFIEGLIDDNVISYSVFNLRFFIKLLKIFNKQKSQIESKYALYLFVLKILILNQVLEE